MEELIHINQLLEFDKLKVSPGIAKMFFWEKFIDCRFSPGHPHHLPDPIFGEEGGAAGNGQRGNDFQHEGEVQPGLPLPLQRSAHHHR